MVEKDGDKKLIIYSMGNFISNQRIETMQDEENAKWTERGVLMDVTIKKKAGKTTIETAKAHPSWGKPYTERNLFSRRLSTLPLPNLYLRRFYRGWQSS